MKSNTDKPMTRCLRCGRRLTAQASVSAGYGRVCRTRIAVALAEAARNFTVQQVEKARELIADGGLVPTGHAGVWRTVSSRGDAYYMTAVEVCSCPAGRNDRRCYHRAAATLLTASTRKAA